MFQYERKQRMTQKFLATEQTKISDAVFAVMEKHGAKADRIKCEVVRGSSGAPYARCTIYNGSGPCDVTVVLEDLRLQGIRCTPVKHEAGTGFTTFTMFQPQDSWIDTTPVEAEAVA